MSRRKWILFFLLIIAFGLLIAGIIRPGVELEYLCYIYSIPVIIMNMWEWFEPEVMVNLFGKN